MEERRNHYRVLHLQPDAPTQLVRVNYLTMMQKLSAHPDLGGKHWSAVHLNAAYATLSDPKKRAAYDRELLAQHDLETLSLGRHKPRVDRAVARRPHTVNRRNYYRVLQVQREAPVEIIAASHRALRAQKPKLTGLLDEAFAVLSDPKQRGLYDELLSQHGHQNALLHMQVDGRTGPGTGYQPLITCYCAFCKTPHAQDQEVDALASCEECDSPLFPPPRSLLSLARRGVSRAERRDPITVYLGWPEPRVRGHVLDLSPTGMKFRARAALEPGDVVKVASRHFDAVGSVAHSGQERGEAQVGLRFLAVRFPEARGNFMSLRA